MMEGRYCGNLSGWSLTFNSPFLPSALLSRPDGKSDRMVSQRVTIVRASRHYERRTSTHHLVVCDAKLTLTKSRNVGACALSSGRSPSISPLLVRSCRRLRIFMCIVVCETSCANQSLLLNYSAVLWGFPRGFQLGPCGEGNL
jgi:hypothetical protein